MNIEGTLSKILSPVEKHGEIVGIGLRVLGEPESIPTITNSVTALFSGQAHLPNVRNIVTNLMQTPAFKSAAMAAIGGYFIKDAIGIPVVSRAAEVAQKVGTGYALSIVAENLLYYSTHSDLGCRKDGAPMLTSNSQPSITPSVGYMNRSIV